MHQQNNDAAGGETRIRTALDSGNDEELGPRWLVSNGLCGSIVSCVAADTALPCPILPVLLIVMS